MARYRKTPVKGKYSAKRSPLGNLLVGRRHHKKSTLRVARDELDTANLQAHTKNAKKFKASERRALESQIRKTKK